MLLDGKFRTLGEIEGLLGYPQASISANLRNLRKYDFGSYTVNKRRRPKKDGIGGTFEYQVAE